MNELLQNIKKHNHHTTIFDIRMNQDAWILSASTTPTGLNFNHVSMTKAKSPEWMPLIYNWFLSIKNRREIWYDLLLQTYCSRNRISGKAFHNEDYSFHFLDDVYSLNIENIVICALIFMTEQWYLVFFQFNHFPTSSVIAHNLHSQPNLLSSPLTDWDWYSEPARATITLQIHLYYTMYFAYFPGDRKPSLQTSK